MGEGYDKYDPEFRLNNREFYDLMKEFEHRKHRVYIPKDFEKESQELWTRGYYYTNGEVNAAFNLFMDGYMMARYIWMDL